MNVLAVGAHPDDLEEKCFGTLRKCIERGDNVYIVSITDGAMGHVEIMPEELKQIRYKEGKSASEVIGAKGFFNLGASDEMLSRYDNGIIDKLVDIIRKVSPDFVIGHYPYDYIMDHEEASAITLNAVLKASLPHYFTNEKNVVGNIPVFYMRPDNLRDFLPTHFVDITKVADYKYKALGEHKSQCVWLKEHDGIDLIENAKKLDFVEGQQCGVDYVESFAVCTHKCRCSTRNDLLP